MQIFSKYIRVCERLCVYKYKINIHRDVLYKRKKRSRFIVEKPYNKGYRLKLN